VGKEILCTGLAAGLKICVRPPSASSALSADSNPTPLRFVGHPACGAQYREKRKKRKSCLDVSKDSFAFYFLKGKNLKISQKKLKLMFTKQLKGKL
jgi:hypothetical protein